MIPDGVEADNLRALEEAGLTVAMIAHSIRTSTDDRTLERHVDDLDDASRILDTSLELTLEVRSALAAVFRDWEAELVEHVGGDPA